MSRSAIPVAVRREVAARAGGTCEYCRLPESHSFLSHEVDHVIAEKHGGLTVLENLALACQQCNSRKGSDLSTLDPDTGVLVRLYNPRTDRWSDHFTRHPDGMIEGTTPIGRGTAYLLQMDRTSRLRKRRAG